MLHDWTRRGFLGFATAATLVGAPERSEEEDCEGACDTHAVSDSPRNSAGERIAVSYEPYCSEESGERFLRLINVNTQEEFEGVYWRSGAYDPDALHQLNIVLRDHKAEKIADFDPSLFDLLFQLNHRLSSSEPMEVISAYRSPATNKQARRRLRRVARNSYHMQAKAVDLRIAGISPMKVRNVARSMKAGGVGYYRRSRFVHVDVGPVRYWYG
jgi:uncharacterized protein YcbK (DUF882 family)